MTMVSAVLAIIASPAVMFPRLVSGAGICKWNELYMGQTSGVDLKIGYNPHTFIQTDYPCVGRNEQDREAFGCSLMDYVRNKTWGQANMPRQAHWNLNDGAKDRFDLKYGPLGDTCARYTVPDYCARAILSELSIMYNGKKRYTSTVAALTSFNGAGTKDTKACGTPSQEKNNRDKVFSATRQGKACWNMVDDWHHLYCSGYNKCNCANYTLDECHRNSEKIQCCRDQFQEFLSSTYQNVRSAANLLEVKGNAKLDLEQIYHRQAPAPVEPEGPGHGPGRVSPRRASARAAAAAGGLEAPGPRVDLHRELR